MNKGLKLRKQKKTGNLVLHLMLLPGVILLIIYSYLPMLGTVMAFQNFKPVAGIFKSKWVGMDNFNMLFSFSDTQQAIGNTLYISFFKIILGLVIPIVFAILINEVSNERFKRITQTIVYLPHFLSWVIMAGILVNILSPSTGLVNRFLNIFGVSSQYFLGDNNLFPWTMIISESWKEFGYASIIYLAALIGIDPGLYEAAAIDGAGRFRQIWHVSLPGIIPIIAVVGTIAVGNVMSAGFDQVFNLYSPQVYASGDILDTLIYRLGMQQANYSLATTVGLFKSAISFVMVSGAYLAAYKFADYKIF